MHLTCLLSFMLQGSQSSFVVLWKKKKDTEKVNKTKFENIYDMICNYVNLCWCVIYLKRLQTEKKQTSWQLCKFSKVS